MQCMFYYCLKLIKETDDDVLLVSSLLTLQRFVALHNFSTLIF